MSSSVRSRRFLGARFARRRGGSTSHGSSARPCTACGERFGDLVIEGEIGRGAFATVYRARDTLMQRNVALKILRSTSGSDPHDEERLTLREARLAGRISSPNIVTVYRVHDLGQGCWGVEMEYVDGGTMADLLRLRGRLPVEETLRLLRGILMGLHAAHEHGVIHRDVKPGNVLLGASDGAIKLADFGLSRTVGDLKLSISSIDGFVGTPQYVAPEIIGGERATHASDLWSVGVIAYRALVGHLPFEASTLPDILDLIHKARPTPLPAWLPARLRAIVHSCLLRDPRCRPSTAPRVLAALEDAAGDVRALAT